MYNNRIAEGANIKLNNFKVHLLYLFVHVVNINNRLAIGHLLDNIHWPSNKLSKFHDVSTVEKIGIFPQTLQY